MSNLEQAEYMTLSYGEPWTDVRICTHCGNSYKTVRGMIKHFKKVCGTPNYISIITGLNKVWEVRVGRL